MLDIWEFFVDTSLGEAETMGPGATGQTKRTTKTSADVISFLHEF